MAAQYNTSDLLAVYSAPVITTAKALLAAIVTESTVTTGITDEILALKTAINAAEDPNPYVL